MTPPSPDAPPRGIVRLLNTAGGRVLCLAGAVDRAVVDSFLRRYGREPARIDGIDAGSVTVWSATALDLVREHLDAARAAGRPVALHGPPRIRGLLAGPQAPVRCDAGQDTPGSPAGPFA